MRRRSGRRGDWISFRQVWKKRLLRRAQMMAASVAHEALPVAIVSNMTHTVMRELVVSKSSLVGNYPNLVWFGVIVHPNPNASLNPRHVENKQRLVVNRT